MNYLGWGSQKKGNLFSLGWGREPEEEPIKNVGGGGMSGKRRRLLKQIEEEDEIVIAFLSSFLQVVDL